MVLLVVKAIQQDHRSGHSTYQHVLRNMHLGCRKGVMKGGREKKTESVKAKSDLEGQFTREG